MPRFLALITGNKGVEIKGSNKGVRPFFSKAYLHKRDIYCYISKCLIYMVDYFMRTTIDIDDQLLLYAKHQAVKQGC